jgi:hypothetical protein
MKMTAQGIDRLIRVANCSRRDMETILDAVKQFDGFPLSDQDNDTLTGAVNALRGFRKDLQLLLMQMETGRDMTMKKEGKRWEAYTNQVGFGHGFGHSQGYRSITLHHQRNGSNPSTAKVIFIPPHTQSLSISKGSFNSAKLRVGGSILPAASNFPPTTP